MIRVDGPQSAVASGDHRTSKPAEPVFERGDLVRTHDGFAAIIEDPQTRRLTLGNGVEVELDAGKWRRMVPIPLNAFERNGRSATFLTLLQPREA